MESQSLEQVLRISGKKHVLLKTSPGKYIARTVMAGMFIGFGVTIAFKTASFFFNVQSPFAVPAAALTFSTAIILIAYAGGDLFTGNAFYFAYAGLKKELRWMSVIKAWFGSWTGNLAGCILFALLILGSGVFNEPASNAFLMKVTAYKMNAPAWELFFRGILCNWLICLAFFIPLSIKNDGPKIFIMILLVFVFFVSGFEHSIANMGTFSIALLTSHPDTVSLSGFIHNMVPVSLGNLVGGAVFTAMAYWYLNDVGIGKKTGSYQPVKRSLVLEEEEAMSEADVA